ncbi:YdcF family protein [Lysobacter pythonis]|uniref:YdcF family protein n=1 Tax=Solilutibacter pythonis TaxID=2483112 RepID=A0A3M2I0M4_9GAMM|nr:YdcF family protein [Lysobacter pythonis]RMH93189.1 YdcF family protein [Lysobacter pythonis]
MTSRAAHRISLLIDRDVLHVSAVALAACTLSAGLVYAAYFTHVLRVARRAGCQPAEARCVLLFGKHAPGGHIDADFGARIERAGHLWSAHGPERIFLLGGGPAGQRSEAEIAQAALLARGGVDAARLHLENHSRDTLQNLRNARALLHETAHRGPITLVSSRYHLARCALFARQLGLEAELCAAEAHFQWSPRNLWRLAGEAGYVCLVDIGTRWARLIGSKRMLERVT